MPENAKILPFGNAHSTKPTLIKIDGVTVNAGNVPILQGACLSLDEIGVTGLIGPNGAGKSVLLRLLTGLVGPSSGTIEIADHLGPPALVFQKPVLLRRTVRANLLHALRIARVPRRERTGRLAELLVSAGLTNQAEAQARTLSGGQQQRLAMARALAERPKLLLLDEPTASLDPTSTAEIEALIKTTAKTGVKIIIVTHDTAQAARLCQDIAFLHRGQVLEHTPADRFFDAPRTDEAKAFLDGELLL